MTRKSTRSQHGWPNQVGLQISHSLHTSHDIKKPFHITYTSASSRFVLKFGYFSKNGPATIQPGLGGPLWHLWPAFCSEKLISPKASQPRHVIKMIMTSIININHHHHHKNNHHSGHHRHHHHHHHHHPQSSSSFIIIFHIIFHPLQLTKQSGRMKGGHIVIGNVLVKVSTTMYHPAEAQGLAQLGGFGKNG